MMTYDCFLFEANFNFHHCFVFQLLFPDLSSLCKLELVENLRTTNKEMKKKFTEQHQDLMDYFKKYTGKDMKDPIDLHTLYTIFTFQKVRRAQLRTRSPRMLLFRTPGYLSPIGRKRFTHSLWKKLHLGPIVI